MGGVTEAKTVAVRDCWFERDVAASAGPLPLVLRVDEISPSLFDLPHRHQDFFALYVVRQGRGIHVIEGIPYSVSRGDVYAMSLGATHAYSQCDALTLDALYFTPDIFDTPMREALTETPGFLPLFVDAPLRRAVGEGGGRWLHLTPDALASVAEMLAELRAERQTQPPSGAWLSRALFVRLLIHLSRRYAAIESPSRGQPAAGGHEATVAAAVRFLDEHFAEPIRVERLAASVFLSPDHFTRVFASAMGRTPSDYLRHLRLERAKSLLQTTDAPISEIAALSGFGEPAYFTRAFRAALGLTPRQFRQQSQ
ncbi:MAG: helix-turn-helix domain-containing protein [Armatimonadota bacterium]|nr:helix-turn-helix domain-containing protein [Armatimonadota bacterium]